MTYNHDGKEFKLDEEIIKDYLMDTAFEFNNGRGMIHRIEAICDSSELQTYFIDELAKEVPSIVLLDVANCDSIIDFLNKRETLARNNAVIVIINHERIFDKINLDSKEQKMVRFYNLTINFLRDAFATENISLKEIMFFTNKQYRDYIKNAYDISSMSTVISLNKALYSKDTTLDKVLESEYLGQIK